MHIKSEFVNDDWQDIYIDGLLVFGNHTVSARNLMKVLEKYPGFTCEYTAKIDPEFID